MIVPSSGRQPVQQPCFGTQLSRYLRTAPHPVQSVRFGRNDFLYVSGQRDGHLYLIESGRVKALMHAPSGKSCLLGIFSRGDIIGESCLLGDERGETVVAMRPTVVTKVPKAVFVDVLATAGLVEECLRYQCARLSEQRQAIALLVTVDSELRLAITLQRLAGQFGRKWPDGLRIEQRLTHEELSDMVGTTRSRIGYFLKRFREAGILVGGGPFLTLDERRLAEYIVVVAGLPVAADG
jgi:CRP/FNR family cyclic AMP-dependent transcriptional regulator